MSFCKLAPSHLTTLLPYQPEEVSCISGVCFANYTQKILGAKENVTTTVYAKYQHALI